MNSEMKEVESEPILITEDVPKTTSKEMANQLKVESKDGLKASSKEMENQLKVASKDELKASSKDGLKASSKEMANHLKVESKDGLKTNSKEMENQLKEKSKDGLKASSKEAVNQLKVKSKDGPKASSKEIVTKDGAKKVKPEDDKNKKHDKVNWWVHIVGVGLNLLIVAFGAVIIYLYMVKAARDRKELSDFNAECVEKHNKYRKMHGVESLAFDESLSESAHLVSKYNQRIERLEDIIEKNSTKIGENLYSTKENVSDKATCVDAVNSWYNEINYYNFATGKSINGSQTNHFTQLVWKATKKVGCGYSLDKETSHTSLYVACQYTPAGNIAGDYLNNVLPKKV